MDKLDHCQSCRNYAESDLCPICADSGRSTDSLCVVESPSDVLALEQGVDFNGQYFVLYGHLSPIDGIGPNELGLSSLKRKVEQQNIKEVIVATNPTVEGEATAHYISQVARQIEQKDSQINISVTRLAQGVPVGGELEYLDQSTLALSLANRSQF